MVLTFFSRLAHLSILLTVVLTTACKTRSGDASNVLGSEDPEEKSAESAFPWPPDGTYQATKVVKAGVSPGSTQISFEIGRSEILEMHTITWEGEPIFERSDVEYEVGSHKTEQVKSYESITLSSSSILVSVLDKIIGRELRIEFELKQQSFKGPDEQSFSAPMPVSATGYSLESKNASKEEFSLKDIKFLSE